MDHPGSLFRPQACALKLVPTEYTHQGRLLYRVCLNIYLVIRGQDVHYRGILDPLKNVQAGIIIDFAGTQHLIFGPMIDCQSTYSVLLDDDGWAAHGWPRVEKHRKERNVGEGQRGYLLAFLLSVKKLRPHPFLPRLLSNQCLLLPFPPSAPPSLLQPLLP